MSAGPGIHEQLRERFGSLVLEDVEFPTIMPDSTRSVVDIVTWCREHAWRILPAGRGHSFGDQHHVPSGVLTVLSLNRRGMSEASARDMAMEVEAGVPAELIQQAAERAGLRLEHWPEGYKGTVGGLFCGPRGPQLRHLMLGAIIVDGTGSVIRLGGAVRKDVSGFDAAGVIPGSRGMIGWLDRIVLKLKPASSPVLERSTFPPSTHLGAHRGLYRQIAAAFDPDDVFFKHES